MLTSLQSLTKKGHARSIQAKKNIIVSFITKGMSIGTSFLLVPLTIHYISASQYGIWLTLSSIVGWFSFFDIGFGHGLRNKFAEAIAEEKFGLARAYVSTTYAILGIVISIVLLIFFVTNPYLNWAKILNTSSVMRSELGLLALIVFVFFCLQFVLQLISTVLTANQESAKASYFNLASSLISLAVIYALTKTTAGNLIYLGLVLSGAPVFVLIISSVWFYSYEYRRFAPSIKYVKLKMVRSLVSLGSKFFFIQIGAVILFETDNIIITQLFSPTQVTTFNIAFRLFSPINMILTIIMTPFWSAFTEAYTKNDLTWIKSIMVKMHRVWGCLVLFTIFILFMSPFIFDNWVGKSVDVPVYLSVAFSIYIFSCTWQTIHVYLLNGIGKIQLQLYLVLISSVINIPLAVFLGKVLGLPGVTLANAVLFITMGIVFSIQTKRILNNNAKGIWNK